MLDMLYKLDKNNNGFQLGTLSNLKEKDKKIARFRMAFIFRRFNYLI